MENTDKVKTRKKKPGIKKEILIKFKGYKVRQMNWPRKCCKCKKNINDAQFIGEMKVN